MMEPSINNSLCAHPHFEAERGTVESHRLKTADFQTGQMIAKNEVSSQKWQNTKQLNRPGYPRTFAFPIPKYEIVKGLIEMDELKCN